MTDLCLLGRGDEPALDAFLAGHGENSMFLRANLRRAGILFRGEPFEAVYMAAVERERIVAVAAHAWNGMVMVQAPVHLEPLVSALVGRSELAVLGLIGPLDQVRRARVALALDAAPVQQDSAEGLYALDLAGLRVPGGLRDGTLACRRPMSVEIERLAEWRHDYSVEALGSAPGEALQARCRQEIELLGLDAQFLLLHGLAPVAFAAFNVSLPEIVQIGGVWVPPKLRGRGYARAVVAGSLLAAREHGAARAVLFTGDDNLPARRAYAALGFRRIGDWGLVLFEF